MHPDLATITTLFNMPRQYAIPIFQRGYVWTLEKQVAPLWFDILDTYIHGFHQNFGNSGHYFFK